MNQVIEDYLQGYTSNTNTLQPAVTIVGSGETLAIPKELLKEMSDETITETMFNCFDTIVENYNILPDELESKVMVFGFPLLAAHRLVQQWMKERGI